MHPVAFFAMHSAAVAPIQEALAACRVQRLCAAPWHGQDLTADMQALWGLLTQLGLRKAAAPSEAKVGLGSMLLAWM
jgi:hypothetical protein